MKNRDKWITIAFLIFILAIPLVTVVRNLLPARQGQELTEAEKAVLEQNGAITEDGTVQTGGTAQGNQPEVTGFAKLQGGLNQFTDGLFGRTKLIAFNTGLTSLLTGGTYIESTQTLKGKNNMFL